jgi:lipid-A-disaccharide synthase-like uncharacterized protein
MRPFRWVHFVALIIFALGMSSLSMAQDTPEWGLSDTAQSFIEKLDGDWTGTIWVVRYDGSRRPLDVELHFDEDSPGEGGYLLFKSGDTLETRQPFLIESSKEREFVRLGDLYLPLPTAGPDSKGEPDARSIAFYDNDEFLAMTFLGEMEMDLQLNGRWELPKEFLSELAETQSDPAWEKNFYYQIGQLKKQGFRITIGPFELVLMEFVGIFATLFFASRFIIQWIASERAKRSVMPELFWWVSLIGSGLMLIYAVYFGRLAVLLGQLTGWTVYVRNIWLIEREKRQRRHEAQAEEQVQE